MRALGGRDEANIRSRVRGICHLNYYIKEF